MSDVRRPSTRNEFYITLITTKEAEADAVEALLDSEWTEYDGSELGKADGDDTFYTLGRIGKHNVVLVTLHSMALIQAAVTAAKLRRSFPRLRLALVVGFCAGIPFPRQGSEVLLGDVIVSTAILHYDFEDQYVVALPRDNAREQVQHDFLDFLAHSASNKEISQLHDSTQDHIQKLLAQPDLSKFRHPGLHNDRLFHPSFRHKHQDPKDCGTCASWTANTDRVCSGVDRVSCVELGCTTQTGQIIERTRIKQTQQQFGGMATTVVTPPMIHFGKMASGNKVVRSAVHRDAFLRDRNHSDVIGIEMEGAGVLGADLPTVVIKGVCDYADTHKNDVWQPWAALTAAACTKALLEMLQPLDGQAVAGSQA